MSSIPASHSVGDSGSDASFAARTYAKVTWRLVPFLFLCYVVAYLDRVNVGFAKLQMLGDLHLSEAVYGLGAGIFFIGYFLFEVPSNIILHKVGARIWIARIMITWGIISGAMMFVTSAEMFYILRFLLGVAEAGFFPGIILYLTYWYPSERRGRIVAWFMTAVPLSGVIGGPLSGWALQSFSGVNGWAGWQWMFLIEAVPSVLVGIATIFWLDDGIRRARWLSDSEKQLLEAGVARDTGYQQGHSLAGVFRSGRVWVMSLTYFSFVMGLYGVGFWLPSIIKGTGVQGALNIGLLSAVPYAVAAVCMVLIGRHSDQQRERRWHIAVPGVLGGIGLILSAVYGNNTLLAMSALTLGTIGIMTTLPLFWSLPTAVLGGTAAAAGIAMINSLGNLAGFVAPFLIGWIKDTTHSTDIGLYTLGASLFLGAALALAQPSKLVDR